MKRKVLMIALAVLLVTIALVGIVGCNSLNANTRYDVEKSIWKYLVDSSLLLIITIILIVVIFVSAIAIGVIVGFVRGSAKRKACEKAARDTLVSFVSAWNQKNVSETLAELIHKRFAYREDSFGVSDTSIWQKTAFDASDNCEIYFLSKLIDERNLSADDLSKLSEEDLVKIRTGGFYGVLKVVDGAFALESITSSMEKPDNWNAFPKAE